MIMHMKSVASWDPRCGATDSPAGTTTAMWALVNCPECNDAMRQSLSDQLVERAMQDEAERERQAAVKSIDGWLAESEARALRDAELEERP